MSRASQLSQRRARSCCACFFSRFNAKGAPGFFIERATRPEPRWSPRAPSTLLERDPYVLGARLKTLAGDICCGARTLPPPWGHRSHSPNRAANSKPTGRTNHTGWRLVEATAVHVVCLPASERPRSYTVPSSPVKMTTSDGCRAAACAARASIGQGCGDSRPVRLAASTRSLPIVNGKGRCVHGNRGRRVRQLHGRCAL
jgi:hypothetical protein